MFLTPLQARLYSLQADPATYCNEPDGKTPCTLYCFSDYYSSLLLLLHLLKNSLFKYCFCLGPPEQFDSWLASVSLEDKKGEISELLVNSPSIRALYTKMVFCCTCFCCLFFQSLLFLVLF